MFRSLTVVQLQWHWSNWNNHQTLIKQDIHSCSQKLDEVSNGLGSTDYNRSVNDWFEFWKMLWKSFFISKLLDIWISSISCLLSKQNGWTHNCYNVCDSVSCDDCCDDNVTKCYSLVWKFCNVATNLRNKI